MEKTEVQNLTEDQALELVLELINNGIEITTGFIKDDLGRVTHQVIRISNGSKAIFSDPEELVEVLRVETPTESGATIN